MFSIFRIGFVALLLLLQLGCVTGGKNSSQNYEEKSSYQNYVDEKWREGYGFNNPNPERAKKGLPPVDFDGKVHDDCWH